MSPLTHISLLLVDDDRDDAALFLEAMAEVDSSIKIQVANDGQQALDMLSGGAPFPSLIFMDINMPRVNGWQCLIKLKQDPVTRNIPVVMFTTSTQDDDKVMAKKLGAADLIVKPSHYAELRNVISQALKMRWKN